MFYSNSVCQDPNFVPQNSDCSDSEFCFSPSQVLSLKFGFLEKILRNSWRKTNDKCACESAPPWSWSSFIFYWDKTHWNWFLLNQSVAWINKTSLDSDSEDFSRLCVSASLLPEEHLKEELSETSSFHHPEDKTSPNTTSKWFSMGEKNPTFFMLHGHVMHFWGLHVFWWWCNLVHFCK